MKTKLAFGGLILVTGVFFGLYSFMGDSEDVSPDPVGGAGDVAPEDADVVIARISGGYEPKEVTIQEGQTVVWINDSDEFHWPASDIHPTHSIYSEFDPLRPVAPQETWSFTFEKVGKWKFHDHLRANYTGTVTVTE